MINKVTKKKTFWFTLSSIAIVISIILALVMPAVRINANNGFLSISINKVEAYSPTWYQDSELHNGLWYSDINNPIIIDGKEVSFMKIYSIAGTLRVMEISTYPRAYKDTDPHVYTVDTPFEVLQDDLNYYYYYDPEQPELPYREGVNDGDFVYLDTHQVIYLLGETAIHYAGEPLPGAFPLWIESETLSNPVVNNTTDTFYYLKIVLMGQLCASTLHEAYWRKDTSTTWNQINADLVAQMQVALDSGDTSFKIPKIKKNQHRYVLRVLYDKVYHN